MKYLLFIGITINLFSTDSCNYNRYAKIDCYNLLQTIFNEDCFYQAKIGQINLTGIDTITILDHNELLIDFACFQTNEIEINESVLINGSKGWTGMPIPKVSKKIINLIKDDQVPERLLKFEADLEDHQNTKYKCYFVLKKISMTNNEIVINLHKLVSNHNIKLLYQKSKGKWILVENEIGKF